MGKITEEIRAILLERLPEATVYVLDPREDGVHLEALVIASTFEGLPLIKQHRMVMQALTQHFDGNVIHALGLKTFTPASWEQKKEQFSNLIS